jgi:hypothetical protein
MILQFGYVTLFAAAFPLGALIALGNNILEIRTDSFKYLYMQKMPFYKAAQDIGSWAMVIKLISFLGILTNVYLVVYGTNYFAHMSDNDRVSAPYRPFRSDSLSHSCCAALCQLLYFFGLEHACLFVNILAGVIIPDVKEETTKQIQEDKAIKENNAVEKEAEFRGRVKHENEILQVQMKEAGLLADDALYKLPFATPYNHYQGAVTKECVNAECERTNDMPTPKVIVDGKTYEVEWLGNPYQMDDTPTGKQTLPAQGLLYARVNSSVGGIVHLSDSSRFLNPPVHHAQRRTSIIRS